MLYLCSGSPTRAGLLERYGIAYAQKPVAFDEESLTFARAEDFVYYAAKGKLEVAERTYGLEVPLLSADTVIASADGSILRKAIDRDDARRILLAQSGAQIAIITSMHYKRHDLYLNDTSATYYRFAPFDTEALEAYLQSDAWQGKAGACMVEGFCKPYIQSVTGWESTAMGLQVEALMPWLERVG
jgi:septum formation protein